MVYRRTPNPHSEVRFLHRPPLLNDVVVNINKVSILNLQDFVANFQLPFSNFSSPTEWQDAFGFSTIQKYPEGFGSLYKIGIHKQELAESLKKVSISVSYGKMTDSGVSLGTGRGGVWDPIDLDFSNEFFYDEVRNVIFRNKIEISGKNLLLFLEEIHKRPTKAIRGFPLRLKLLFWRKMLPAIIKIFDRFLVVVLWIISGEVIPQDIIKRFFSDRREEKVNKKISEIDFHTGKTMEFFGYHAKRWSVVFYCSLHLTIYLIFLYKQNVHFLLIGGIGRNSFLTLCYIVLSFAITESWLPDLIKFVIKKTPNLFTKIAFGSIKII